MKLKNYTEIDAAALQVPGAKDVSIRVLIGPAEQAPNFMMLFLELAPGGNTPDHAHEWEEEIFVNAGEGLVKSAGDEQRIRAGDVLYFAPNESHQFINSSCAALSLICVIPKRG